MNDNLEVIQILLEEYRTLRQETVALISAQSSLGGYGIAAVGLTAALSGSSLRIMLTIAVLVVIAILFYLRNVYALARLSAQLATLEARINALTPDGGSRYGALLSWETRQQGHPGPTAPFYTLARRWAKKSLE